MTTQLKYGGLHPNRQEPVVRPTICQALSCYATQRDQAAFRVFNSMRHTVVIAELEFRRIAVQVLLTTVLIHALHAALEDAEIALNRVGVDDATAILTLAVSGEIVLGKVLVDAGVL